MSDLSVDKTLVKPLNENAPGERYTAAFDGDLGDAVYIKTDGTVAKSANASGFGVGIVVSSNRRGSTTFKTGDKVVVVFFGPVTGFSGLVPGTMVYLSANAGKLATTGTKKFGYAQREDTVFVMPDLATAAS